MRVLISAIACDPFGWSETFVGWQAVSAIAKDHDVWVLTDERYRSSFEKASSQGAVPASVTVVYHGTPRPWHQNRSIARLQSWLEFLDWNKTLLPIAMSLHQKTQFDVAHHVTYSTWRVPSPLWKLPVPLVWGPIGGAGSMPMRFWQDMSASGRVFEASRSLGRYGRFSPALKQCATNAAWVLASNAETLQALSLMRGTLDGVSVLSPGFFTAEQLARSIPLGTRGPRKELTIFAGGSIIGSKGYPLALHALREAKARGLKFRFTIAGSGPETKHVSALVERLELPEVSIIDALSGEAYRQALSDSDVYLLPSFRENIGLTMMEAMLQGVVPIVLDRSAPGEIVTEECGVKIRVQDSRQIISDIADALVSLVEDQTTLRVKREAAVQRIKRDFSEENYRRSVGEIYERVVRRAL